MYELAKIFPTNPCCSVSISLDQMQDTVGLNHMATAADVDFLIPPQAASLVAYSFEWLGQTGLNLDQYLQIQNLSAQLQYKNVTLVEWHDGNRSYQLCLEGLDSNGLASTYLAILEVHHSPPPESDSETAYPGYPCEPQQKSMIPAPAQNEQISTWQSAITERGSLAPGLPFGRSPRRARLGERVRQPHRP